MLNFFKLLYYLYKLSAANIHFRINSSVCLKLVLFNKFCIVFKHLSVLYNLSLHLFLKVDHLNIPYKNICIFANKLLIIRLPFNADIGNTYVLCVYVQIN